MGKKTAPGDHGESDALKGREGTRVPEGEQFDISTTRAAGEGRVLPQHMERSDSHPKAPALGLCLPHEEEMKTQTKDMGTTGQQPG